MPKNSVRNPCRFRRMFLHLGRPRVIGAAPDRRERIAGTTAKGSKMEVVKVVGVKCLAPFLLLLLIPLFPVAVLLCAANCLLERSESPRLLEWNRRVCTFKRRAAAWLNEQADDFAGSFQIR